MSSQKFVFVNYISNRDKERKEEKGSAMIRCQAKARKIEINTGKGKLAGTTSSRRHVDWSFVALSLSRTEPIE